MADIYAEQGMMRTQNGWVSLLDPQPEQIRLDDIIYALGNTNRFTGHSEINVLEHSVRAYLFACDMGIEDPQQLLTVLMHDAHEAYVNDVSSPLKIAMRRVGSIYDELEKQMADCVARAFNLDDIHADYVKEADMRALAAEVEIIWGPMEVVQWGLDRQERLMEFAPWPAARQAFRTYFNGLVGQMADHELAV